MKACMESVLKHKGALSSGELWMLTVMVYAHDEDHHLAASHKQLADLVGMKPRNAQRLTLMLREKGLIRLVSEDGGKNVYALPCAAPVIDPAEYNRDTKNLDAMVAAVRRDKIEGIVIDEAANQEDIRAYLEHIGLEDMARDAKAKIVNIGDIDL